jgi:hypothetical protein
MSKAVQLQIPEPCHENWHNMTSGEQGRFCGSCQKMVVDFSVMSDKAILDYISNASQHLCGRFSHDQLNREIKVTENKRRFSWVYVWNLLLATFMVTESYAQGKPVVKKKPVTTKKPVNKNKPNIQPENLYPMMGAIAVVEPDVLPAPREISGTVWDKYTNEPVVGASVWMKGSTKGTVADTNGVFHLKVEKEDSITLEITAIGYRPVTRLIDSKTNWQDVKVLMGEMEVTMGLIVVGEKVPKKEKAARKEQEQKKEKVKRTVSDWVAAPFKKDIKIYPNPVVRGSDIQANVSLKQAGSYQLELIDVQGRVMEVQKLVMVTKEQQVTISTQTDWGAGIYWIRITAPDVKNVYQAKVSLQ